MLLPVLHLDIVRAIVGDAYDYKPRAPSEGRKYVGMFPTGFTAGVRSRARHEYPWNRRVTHFHDGACPRVRVPRRYA